MPDLDTTVFAFPVAIASRASDAALLELARTRIVDPAILDEFPPYFFAARASTDRTDAYNTWMMRSTLHNFAEDAAAGVAFQDSHKTDGIARTLGQSLTGKDVGPGGNGIAHMDADFYTLTGLDPAIDSFVRKMRGGLVRDVSVGFYGGAYLCSICGRDMMSDYECWHYPGMMAYPLDKKGEPDRSQDKVMVTAGIDGAHLAEVSIVYDGATPGAMILRAQRDIDAGRLRPEQVRALEVQYRTKLPGMRLVVPGHDLQESPMPEPAEPRVTTIDSDALRALLAEANITTDDVADGMRQLITENARLRPLAADGETYRTSRQDRAWAAYVRFNAAKGTPIAADTETQKRDVWQRMAVTDLDAMADGWEEYATAKLGGGRQTIDTSERDDASGTSGGAHPSPRVPDAAYRTR